MIDPASRSASATAVGVEVRSPASSANLGPGFDCVGLALSLYTTVRATPAERAEVVTNLPNVPTGPDNFVYRSCEMLAAEAGRRLPPLRLEVAADVPLARGLGSSASALVAGLVAANHLLAQPLTPAELLDLAAREEGHPDNVGAALLGGVVIATTDAGRVSAVRVSPPERLGALVLVPDFELSTARARAALPDHFDRADAVHALSHAALLAAALTAGRLDLLGAAMRDRLHQPYRAPLVPGLTEVLNGAAEHGALGAALSGAGPSVLCLYDRESIGARQTLTTFLTDVLSRHGGTGRVLDLPVDHAGTTVRSLDRSASSTA